MESSVRLAAVGDIGIRGKPAGIIRSSGPRELLSDVEPLFAGSDLTLFNLELPFTRSRADRPRHIPEHNAVDPSFVEALTFPGIRIACLANNHIMDFGVEGLRTTVNVLREAGIHWVGAGMTADEARQPLELSVRGVKLAFLAYAAPGEHSAREGAGAAVLSRAEMLDDIEKLRPRVDAIVLSLHMGLNYVDLPSPSDRELKRELVEAGVDLIVGHHPHVLQGMERIGSALVAHSLGEFVFDGTMGNVVATHASEKRRQTAVLLADLTRRGLGDWRLEPAWISDLGKPEPAGERTRRIRDRLRELESLFTAKDYQARFTKNASDNVVFHSSRVLWAAARRGDSRYLYDQLLRIRPRHLRLLVSYLVRRFRN